MIVCSCNVVSSDEIKGAVEELIASDREVVLTPGLIYRTIGCRPKCGACLNHVVKLMHAHRESLEEPSKDKSAAREAPLV